MEYCDQLIQSIENDCIPTKSDLDGKMRDAYIDIRKEQLQYSKELLYRMELLTV